MRRRIFEKPGSVVTAGCMEFPPSHTTYTHLLVFQDLFTRWFGIIPVKRTTGKIIARSFEALVLVCWDVLSSLLVENSKEFDNKIVKATCQEYGVKLVPTLLYRSEMNPIERTNRTIKQLIRTYTGEDHQN